MLRKFLPWERQIPEEEVLSMEDYLSTLMTPVVPRGEFVRRLQQGLDKRNEPVQHKERLSIFQRFFWIGAGFGSAVVLLTVGLRVIINLIRGNGLGRKSKQKGIAPLR